MSRLVMNHTCVHIQYRNRMSNSYIGIADIQGGRAAYLCYGTRLVISANELHAIWIAQFKACQKGDCFHAEESPVNIITCPSGGESAAVSKERGLIELTKKEIIGMGSITTYTKNLDKVIELT